MADRLPSDHDDVETRRVTVSQVGRTGRPQVELPTDLSVAEGDVVEFALNGTRRYARVETALRGTRVVRHVAANRRLASERDGENRLAAWADRAAVEFGGSVHLDVVTPGHTFGLRTPGTRVVYDATEGPDDSLADIARDLEDA